MSSFTDSSWQDRRSRIKQILDSLRDSIVCRPPFVAGSLQVPPFHLSLLYKDKSSEYNHATSHINFANATPEELEQLAQACEPASQNSQEVYHGAKKMDKDRFSTLLVPDHTDLIKVVRTYLLEGDDWNYPIKIEPHKLKVYGEGSFFKANLTIRHNEDMFGSLVVVFPTPHEGGTLAFRRGDQEWMFDPSDALSTAPPNSIAYAAFFWSVEHEISPVTSGHCVTLTYSLCYDNEHGPAKYLVSEPPSVPQEEVERMFHSRFNRLLKDPEFLPNGGLLGFGIRNVYQEIHTRLGHVYNQLKGSDATVYQSLRALGFKPAVCLNYKCEDNDVLVNHAFSMDSRTIDNLSTWIRNNYSRNEITEQVTWVTPRTTRNALKSPYMSGWDRVEWARGDLCLIVRVGSLDNRLDYGTF